MHRDLTARLREIVKTPAPRPTASPRGRRTRDSSEPSSRTLTYVPELPAPPADGSAVAERLGGRLHDASCVIVDRVWEPDQWHGRMRVDSCVVDARAPIALFDSRAVVDADWASRVIFFDLETTGLSGGAGTLAFLAGCGWFENGGFRVRQFFLSGPAGEHAMLDGLAEIFDTASLLVTFNGRTFDVPLMETRWAFHRRECPTDDLPHFDMLPPARRLWRWRDEDDRDCSLTSLERAVLRFYRSEDVPGFELPSRYFQFLRTGDPAVIHGVLAHNQHDLMSLAAVLSHALKLAQDGAEACETSGERLALGRLYERAGDLARALQAYELAAHAADRDVSTHALARLAVLLRREARHDDAASAWRRLLDRAPKRGALSALERRAVEALAIHHEHRRRDLNAAKQYAQSLRAAATGRIAHDADHRLGRLNRKLNRENEPGGPQAAWLLLD